MNNINKIPTVRPLKGAAELAGIAKYALRQWVLNGKVRCGKAGNKILVIMDSLIEFLTIGEVTRKEIENETKIRKVQ